LVLVWRNVYRGTLRLIGGRIRRLRLDVRWVYRASLFKGGDTMKTDDGAGARKPKLGKYECIFCGNIVEREESDEENCTPAICNAFAWKLVAERGEVGSVPERRSGKTPLRGKPIDDNGTIEFEVGSVGQGEPDALYVGDELDAIAEKIEGEWDEKAQPEAGAVTQTLAEQIVAEVFPSMDSQCAVRYVAQTKKRIDAFLSVAPSVEPLNRMLGEALGHVKTMQATLEQVFDLCDEYLHAPSLSKSSSMGILDRVCEIIHNETGRKSGRESKSIEFKAVAPSVEEPVSQGVEAARSHLRVALSQALPTDDQIIIGHIRSALGAMGK
jgi:hypothetical protein